MFSPTAFEPGQIQGHAPDAVICTLSAAHWKVKSSRRDLEKNLTYPEWTTFSPGSDLGIPFVTSHSWFSAFLGVGFELTDSLCKLSHLRTVSCKPKIYF